MTKPFTWPCIEVVDRKLGSGSIQSPVHVFTTNNTENFDVDDLWRRLILVRRQPSPYLVCSR